MKPAAKLPPPRWRQRTLRRVCGQHHADGRTILHLTCGHHLRVNAPRPAETWVWCDECSAAGRGGNA